MRTPDLQARSVVAILAPILGFFTVLVVTIWTIKLHIQKIYVFPSPSVCVFLDLRTNSDNSPVEHWLLYRGCPGRNVPDFGRMFLKLKSTDLTQNTYIRSWTVTERMAREKCGVLRFHVLYLFRVLLAVHCACPSFSLTAEPSTFTLRLHYQQMSRLQWIVRSCKKCLLCFPTWNIVTCILCVYFAMAMHVLVLTYGEGVFLTARFRLGVYFLVFTRQCVRLIVFQVLLCSLKGRWYQWLTHERTFCTFREVHDCPFVELPFELAGMSRMQVWRRLHEENLYPYLHRAQHLETGDSAQRMDLCHRITARLQLFSVILFSDEASFTQWHKSIRRAWSPGCTLWWW